MKSKLCPGCGHSKAISEFPAGRIGAVRARCKICTAQAARAWRKANPDKVKLQKKREYEKAPGKVIARVQRWRQKNPEKYAAQLARQTQKNREDDIARLKAWKSDPENRLESGRRYRKKYSARVRAHTRRYQAAKRKAIPAWANLKEIEWFYARAMQLAAETGTPHEVDHIVPLISQEVCGLHWEGNLQVLPRFDNRSKSNRLVEV